ncbi:neutral/alkaline non-lysosomal ceramidase N-terminal domain-containing protein [Chitinophaga arvensicola]|uniref:Neutral/alkaline non-lysosomal ceramidase, N-terminal n=1 Tax=Chitinophaga arvensicola TaxID=29529 RepID=A0A1I0S7X0_9BACT|nr:neutral/alkaline non-lysosomal ceramidase N-terminal domain-containing protein [Chitinophaga arvensicola]SEW51930.1 Neutral/alkaline non-lysosomal ceramidase, N-terminal [Chitinophaga arvensicola]
MKQQTYAPFRNPSFKGWIGTGREDITPPAGIYARNWGAAKHEVAAGIHMPLTLTAFSFQEQSSGEPLILISADLGWWKSAADERRLREGILAALSLQPYQLMFCLTHTHAGPSTFTEDVNKPGGELIAPYLALVQQAAVKAAENALKTATTATLTWHYGKCDLACNRELPEAGSDRIITGLNPQAAADDTLLVGRITSEAGVVTGTIVNYACHPTTLGAANDLLSPDYIGAMRALVELHTGASCLFLQGASGELSPAEQYSGDTSLADHYGRQLGFAVLSALEAMLPPDKELQFTGVVESGASLAMWAKACYHPAGVVQGEMTRVPLPLKALPSLAEIEAAWEACEDHVIKERLWRQRGIRKTIGDGEVSEMPLWVWRLGDGILIGQPNETYSDFQQELRKLLSPAAVAVMNIVNGYAGYLPPETAYSRQSYAVWQTPFAPGALELLTASATAISQRLILST